MKNTFVKVLSMMMALMMVVGAFSMITVSAAECAHANSSVVAVVEPICVTPGFTRYLCADCGEEYIDDIKPATGKHDWKDQPATEATCTEPAYSAHKKCANCPAVKDRKPTSEIPGGHDYSKVKTVAATCTEDGYSIMVCIACDAELKGSEFAPVPASHKYIYTIVAAPTACTSGTMKVTCSVCDYSEVIVETEDHNWKDMKDADAAIKAGTTCKDVYESGKYCVDCKAIHPDSKPNSKKTHNYAFVGFAKIDENNLNAKLAALGFKVGDATTGAEATCTSDSWVLKLCSLCGEYTKDPVKVNEGKGHKWGAWGATTPADIPANHAVDKKQTRECENCDATETKVVKAASACTYTKEGAVKVIAATCEANGYTAKKCDLCGITTNTDVTFKTGHNYGAAQWSKGVCDSGKAVYIQKCPNKGCQNPVWGDAEDETVTPPKGSDKCVWVKTTKPATCMKPAEYYYKCSVCGTEKAYDKTDKPAQDLAPNNHVVNSATAGNYTPVEKNPVKAATCTDKAKYRYLCECGVLVDVEVGNALGHNKGTVYHAHGANAACNANCKDVGFKLADCKTAGIKKAGELCTRCGVILTAPVVEPINPNNHKEADKAYAVDSDVANCSSPAYTTKYYPCCEKVHKIETGNKNPDNHTVKGNSVIKDVAEKAATCTETGIAAHKKCAGCGKLFDLAGNAINAPATLETPEKNKDHKWVDPTDYKPEAETCTETGIKAHKECAHCDAILLDGVVIVDNASTKDNEVVVALTIPAHKDKYIGWHAGVKATCTTDGYTIKGGYTAVYACSKCDKDPVGKFNHNEEVVKVTKTPQNCIGFDKDTGKPIGIQDCTDDTFLLCVCECGHTYFENYNKPTNAAHVFKQNDKKQDVATEPGVPTCTAPAQDLYACTACAHTEFRTGAPALGHKINVNNVDIKVDFSCVSADHKTYVGKHCVVCQLVLGTDVEHDYVSADLKPATCTTDGHEAFDYCKDCNKVKEGDEVKVLEATNHAKKIKMEVVDGQQKYFCPDCQTYVYEAIKPVANEVYTLSADKVAAGEIITVTYAISGAETKFSAMNIDVDFDALNLTFVGIEAAEIDGLYAVAVDNGDSIGVSLVVANDATGAKREVVTSAEGTVLFTLTFVANKTASGLAYVGDKNLTINAVGNLNGDAVVTADDAQAIFAKIGTNDVAADVNLDGVVTLADVIALAKFAASNKTVADYLEMVGELDKLEAEVFAIYEAGRINDVNGDGVANIADAYELINEIEYAMNYNYSALGNIVTMAELVALANKYA